MDAQQARRGGGAAVDQPRHAKGAEIVAGEREGGRQFLNRCRCSAVSLHRRVAARSAAV